MAAALVQPVGRPAGRLHPVSVVQAHAPTAGTAASMSVWTAWGRAMTWPGLAPPYLCDEELSYYDPIAVLTCDRCHRGCTRFPS
jgi:hypothetical protein